jgi:hypothetical protein
VRRVRVSLVSAIVVAVGSLACAGVASANPISLPTITKQLAKEPAVHAADAKYLNPPAPPCPESGQLPSPFSNCGLPETPATSLPFMGNLAYWGGHVQVHPKEYLAFWGWGEPGAFPGRKCSSEAITEGSLSATLACDPDGAGKYMADFEQQMGGTGWANVSTQYYQSSSSGNQYISNDHRSRSTVRSATSRATPVRRSPSSRCGATRRTQAPGTAPAPAPTRRSHRGS